MQRIILIAFPFFISNIVECQMTSSGTCVIIFESKNFIWVGSDTREVTTFYNHGNSGVQKIDTVCKIRKFGDFYVSMSGTNVKPLYLAASISCTTNKRLLQIANDFAAIGYKLRKQYLDSIRSHDSIDYEFHFKELAGFESSFYGFEDNVADIINVDFTIISKENEPVKLKDSIYKGHLEWESESQLSYKVLGHSDSIIKLLNDTNWLKTKQFPNVIEELILIEASRDTLMVAKPIDLLAIINGGKYKWLKGPAKCNY